jgi:F0F1-type ATP synthase assembly protein I
MNEPSSRHEPSNTEAGKRSWASRLLVPEMWATLAIVAMWLAVLFVGVFGQNFVSNNSGINATIVPSAIFIALFACIATASVAKRGFRRDSGRDD